MAPRIQLDHHIHHKADDGLNCRLERIEQLLVTIKQQQGELMALTQESKDLLGRIDTTTTKLGVTDRKMAAAIVEVAKDVQELLDKPNTSEAEFREALAPFVATAETVAGALDAQADFLTKLGADTNAPVPPLPPEPEIPPAI